MNRVVSLFLAIILLVAVCMIAPSAAQIEPPTVVDYGEITVIFGENSSLTAKQRLAIAKSFALHDDEREVAAQRGLTGNIICNIFGHKKISESITIIEHCVRATNPRCLETIGDLITCARCSSYRDFEELGSYYTFCCPED